MAVEFVCCRYVFIMYNNQKIKDWVSGKTNKTYAGDEESATGQATKSEGEEEEAGANINDSRFRASLLTLMTGHKNLDACAGMAMVTKITGTVEQVFKKYDTDNSGYIDKEELKTVFTELGCDVQEVRRKQSRIQYSTVQHGG
jgi:EF hand